MDMKLGLGLELGLGRVGVEDGVGVGVGVGSTVRVKKHCYFSKTKRILVYLVATFVFPSLWFWRRRFLKSVTFLLQISAIMTKLCNFCWKIRKSTQEEKRS